MFEFIFIVSVNCLKISEKKWVAQKMAKKVGGSKDGCQKLFGRKYGCE